LVTGSNLWFKFYSARWMGSEDVLGMSAADRGVYISLIAAYHQYGPLPANMLVLAKLLVIDRRTLAQFIQKWPDLALVEQELNKIILPKCNRIIEGVFAASHKKERIERKERKSEGQDLQPLSKDEERKNAERVFKQLEETEAGAALAERWS